MNRYQTLIQQLKPADGFEVRLKRRVLNAGPVPKKTYHPRSAVRTVLLAAVVAVALTASAAAVVSAFADWDPIFVRLFRPTETEAALVEEAVQTEVVTSVCGDTTLKIRQTIGDGKSMYFIMDVTFPKSVDLSALVDQNGDGRADNYAIHPVDMWFYTAETTYTDIAGMTYEQAREFLDAYRYTDGSLSSNIQNIDLDSNTITYLMQLTVRTVIPVAGQPLTALIDTFEQSFPDGTETTVVDGPFLISWTADYDAASRTFDIKDGEETIGTVTLSPLSLRGVLKTTDYLDSKEFRKTLSLTFINGDVCLPANNGPGIGIHEYQEGVVDKTWYFEYHFDVYFRDILVVDEVASVQVGGYSIDVK